MSMVLQVNPNDDNPFNSARWVPASEVNKDGVEKIAATSQGDRNFFSEEGLTFGDVLDMVNPLQHLPIIGPLYREITGDTLSPGARLVGGTLFGGPIGLIASAMELGAQDEFGRDPGGMLIAAAKGEDIAPNYAGDAVMIGETVPTGETAPAVAALPSAAPIVSEPLAGPQVAAVAPQAVAAPAALAAPKVTQSAPMPAAAGGITFNGRAPGASAAGASPVSGVGPSAQLPPNSTGLLTSSGLPSAGSVTPALTMVQTQNPMQQDPMGQMTGNAGVAAYQSAREAPGGAQQASQPAIEVTADGQRFFDLPANRAPVRQPAHIPPVIQNPNVGVANTAPAQLGAEPTAAQVLNPIAPTATPGNVNDSMRSALDKYDALIRSRKGGAAVNQAL